MTNNLRVLKKELKSFAKKVKDFKYTDSALITFLLTGTVELGVTLNAHAAQDEIETQKKVINTSISDMHQQFKRVKSENDKLMKDYNLELIQLMEQGDHVVKSPWSSWQYGINGIYNDWQGKYKGRGDKTPDVKYERDKTLAKYKYNTNPNKAYGYGNTTELGLKQEPNAVIPVSASLQPLIPRIKTANVSMAVDISDLPSFTPRTVTPPSAPVVSTSVTFTPPTFSLVGESLGNGNDEYFDTANNAGGHGVIEGVSLISGNFATKLTELIDDHQSSYVGNQYRHSGKWDYGYNNYLPYNVSAISYTTNNTSAVPSGNLGSGSLPAAISRNLSSAGSKTGFLKMASWPGDPAKTSTMINNANLMYTRKGSSLSNYTFTPTYDGVVKEVVHLDFHGAQKLSDETSKVNRILGALPTDKKGKVQSAWNELGNIATAKSLESSQTFINSGTSVVEGSYVTFSNSYDHTNGTANDKWIAAAMNVGDIIVHPMKENNTILDSNAAVFLVSAEVFGPGSGIVNGTPQLLYNSGKIKMYDKNSAIFFINPDPYERTNNTKARRDITIINRNGKIEEYGDKSVGVYVKTPNFVRQLNLDFSKDQTKADDFTPMTLYGDNSIGLYVENVDDREAGLTSSGKSTGSATSITKASNAGDSVVYGNFAVNIGDSNDTGNQQYTSKNTISISNNPGTIDEHSTEGTPDTFDLNNTNPKIEKSFGIFSNYNIDFSKDSVSATTGINKFGHQINIFGNTDQNIGVLTGNEAIYKLGKGSINLSGKNSTGNIGVLVGGSRDSSSGNPTHQTDGKVIGDVVTITGASDNSDRGNRAIVAVGKNSTNTVSNSVEVNEVKSIGATNSIAIVADDHSTVKVNSSATNSSSTTTGVNISGSRYEATPSRPDDNVGAAYANNGATITIDRTVIPTAANISIEGGMNGTKHMGFGLFANNNGNISAKYNSINVTNASTAIAALNGGKVDLDHSQVEYSGEGYALYAGTDSSTSIATPPVAGEIKLTNGKLVLGGKAVGYVKDQGLATPSVVLTGTNIDVKSDDVIIADLRNSATGIVTVDVDSSGTPLKTQLLGAGVGTITPVAGSGATGKHKYAVVDNAEINIKSVVDKADSTTDSDSEVFSKRFLYQNSRVNVESGASVKAELNTAQSQATGTSLPVGLAVTGSANSTNNSTTKIGNKGDIVVDRTDSGQGGIGLYVDYGQINNYNSGTINVEKGTVNGPNDKAIGIYGTNNTNIVNDGAVNVGGNKSIGILGLSYRIDHATGLAVDPTTEPYYASATNKADFGKINIENSATGTITMDNDGAVGMFVKNNSKDSSVTATYNRAKSDLVAVNRGTITMNGNNSAVGMGADNGTVTNDTAGKIYVNGTKSVGMYGTKDSDLTNNGEINVVATSAGNESIGMYIDDQDSTITNTRKINVGQSSYGIYGKKVNMNGGEINVADDGVGVYSTGPTVNLNSGKVTVANNNSVGVYIADDRKNPQPTTVTSAIDMKVGDTDSFGYLITATNAKTDLTINPTPNDVHVGEKSVYVYSAAPQSLGGKIINHSNIVMDKNNGYGIYSSQDSENYGDINLTSGVGNIGVYSTQGMGRNHGTITVGPSNVTNKEYGIGMATGYYDEATKAESNIGTIENVGTINVSDDNSVGMYAVGTGSKAINRGTINLSGNNTTGMYIDRHAIGENYGTIQTTPTANGKGIKGVVVTNGGVIKNYGTINIQGAKNIGVYAFRGDETSSKYVPYEENGTGNISTRPYVEGTATDRKTVGKASVKVPPASLPSAVSISIDGVDVAPTKVDTNIASPQAPEVLITDLSGVTKLNLAAEQMDHDHTDSNAEISSIGMYVDTSGINYTQPIQGLSNLSGLTDVDLIMGTEVTKYLNAKAIQIGDNILKPYNDALSSVVSTGVDLNVNSASLTWLAQPVESGNVAAPIKTVYMVKIPYTDFASKNDVDTEHFLDGLEQRYGVEGIHSREKQIFNKLNSLGKGESHIFAQAVNEMKGYEYSNTQQRIYETGNALDKEFKYLHDEWRNPSKQNNKIKVFGQKDEYNTDTAGVIDYDSNAYGVAYVHEDETVKLGNSSGWYAGAVTNRFKFKDLGKSTEQDTMIKAGIFKTMSPYNDHNGSLRWTVAGDVFGGINNMRRKFWVVDDTFESKGDYYTYGAAFKTDLGYDIRLSERTHLRPYGALKMEYGRFTNVNEDRGEMNLEVKGNDYFSVKPEVGAEFKYVQPLAVRTQLSVGLSAAYENELGKLNRLNQARVRYTTADWYNLRNEKENRKGNGKFDLNIGIDNTRFGVTVNAGYDTKGENIRGGIGFRAIY